MIAGDSTYLTLLRHAWARHRVILGVTALGVGLFEFLGTRIAPAPNETGFFTALLATLPPNIRAMLGNEIAASPSGFLAFGYAHPFFMILMSVWIVRTSAGAVAGEIGRGTMDLLASRPVPRWHFIAAGITTTATGVAAILLVAWFATAIGLYLRPIGVDWSAFWPLMLTAWLLFAAWGALGLAIGATRRDAGQAIAWTTTILATSFALDYLARLWTPISALRPISLFRYYEPQSILANGMSPAALGVLVAVTAGALASALATMAKRDL